MPGERYSVLYVERREPSPDSSRARHRVGALLGEPVFKNHGAALAGQLGRNLGVPLPGQSPSHWHQFVRDCCTADFLDMITVVHRYLFWHLGENAANWWRDATRQIFNEENLGYEIDDSGGLHPRIDREFQRNLTSTVAGLEAERYHQVRSLVAISSTNLCSDPPNYRQALRASLSALEVLFGLMFPYGRLTTDEIDHRLKPVVERAYDGDAAAQKAAEKMLAGLKDWVEASQSYRHLPGMAETPQPPADIAILSISQGACMLRWLAGLAELRTH